jgi:hypothetical protein
VSSIRSPNRMKGNEEETLVRVLKDMILIDREIEDERKALAMRSDFN